MPFICRQYQLYADNNSCIQIIPIIGRYYLLYADYINYKSFIYILAVTFYFINLNAKLFLFTTFSFH